MADRLTVVVAPAESAARTELRATFDLVVARSFGPPAVTAECARGFLVDRGTLAVSEPPEATEGRWPAAGLEQLGLTGPELRHARGTSVALLRAAGPPDDRWPRGPGIPAKRPLW